MIAETTNPDFKILAADDELVEAVLVVVGQDKGGHIVSSHRPERVVALIVESLQRAVSAHNGKRAVRRTQLSNRYSVRSIRNLFIKEIPVFLDIIRQEGGRGSNRQDIPLHALVKLSRREAQDPLVDVQHTHLQHWHLHCVGDG